MSPAPACIPGLSAAQVRVTIRSPPCPPSIRRIVVPIGSDGVMPQRGRPPSRASASASSFGVITAKRKSCISRPVSMPKLSRCPLTVRMTVGAETWPPVVATRQADPSRRIPVTALRSWMTTPSPASPAARPRM
jgi:hypothetical protein